MLEKQAVEIKKSRALEKVFGKASLSMMVAKTKAFCRWREAIKECQSSTEFNDNSSFEVSRHQ